MGYDKTRFVGAVDEELICPICKAVLEDPRWWPDPKWVDIVVSLIIAIANANIIWRLQNRSLLYLETIWHTVGFIKNCALAFQQ